MTKRGIYFWMGCFMAVCALQWAACNQVRQPCLTPKQASFNLELMHLATDTATIFTDTTLTSAQFIALANIGPASEQFLQQLSVFPLSLSPDTGFCRWAFRTDTLNYTVYDTLSFYYTRLRQFLSNACGYTYFYTLDSVHSTHIMIDSVHISNPSITNDVNTPRQLQIFIHPDF